MTDTPAGELAQLIPVPPNTRNQDDPKPIHENGIKMHFFVSGSPDSVLQAYRESLTAAGWEVTGSADNHGGTFKGSNAAGNYVVATGGGHGSQTNINVGVWNSHPSDDHV